MSRQADRYFTGPLAVCRSCKERPCSCGDQAASSPAPAAVPIPLQRPSSGNAIPFAVWDVVIPRYKLSLAESGVLLYLCRRTIGYGHHAGDLVSERQVAMALNIGRSTAQRALDALQRHGLIERQRRFERNSKERGTTHIQVTLTI